MAAKLLHSLADENPDLQKQIGCMAGIFQIFDRHHVLTGKRITHKRLPQGNSSYSNGSLERQSNNVHYHQSSAEMSLNKSASEKQRPSTESSRASFLSACSSSASSADFDRTTQQEVSSCDRAIFPETSSRDPGTMSQTNTSPRFGRHSLDLRDVVKDSMYREAKGLSIKTLTRDEPPGRVAAKHRDSPRPYQNASVDLKESLRVLVKLREAPCYYNDFRESRDAPRFSCDGRETGRASFESWDPAKSAVRLKELPRLSLDGRESSIRGSNFGSKTGQASRTAAKSGSGVSSEKEVCLAQKRPPSVVAKLMGLDALPDNSRAGDAEPGTFPALDTEPGSKPLKISNVNRPVRTPNSSSPRGSAREPGSPRWRNPDLVVKPVSSSRFPIEPAPWKMQDGNNKTSPRTGSRAALRALNNSFPWVYSEIEKRHKDLKFKQSGKDLRALKQILEAMQAKGLLETSGEEQSRGQSLGLRPASQQGQPGNPTARGSGSGPATRTFESPIVIMKPAKLVEKSGMSSLVVPADVLANIVYKPGNMGPTEAKKGGPNNAHSPKYGLRDSSIALVDKRGNPKNAKPAHSSSRSQLLLQTNDNNAATSSAKSSGSAVSPRLHHKKLDAVTEKQRSRPPTSPSSSSKPWRQTNKQSTESGSPGGRSRPKYHPTNSQQFEDQSSEISNDSKSLSCHGDDASVHSEGNVVSDSKSDVEVTSSVSVKGADSSVSDVLHKKAIPRLDEDSSFAELAMLPPEHPSPVSVLDASAYKDDEPSPLKQITMPLKGIAARDPEESTGEVAWEPANNVAPSGTSMPGVAASEMSRKKLKNIENLVQKLRRVNSSHDEARTDYIASLCEKNTNPDHRYVSEILLASGLLLRDLGPTGLAALQPHPSGHPINPELFFVLEQTKSREKPAGPERLRRMLIFDAVNEALAGKLASSSACAEPWLWPSGPGRRLARKALSAQRLLKELCLEIEHLAGPGFEAEDGDLIKAILRDDVTRRSGSWTDFSGVVLDVERSIFKDLVDEVVRGEAVYSRTKPGRRRQLFAK